MQVFSSAVNNENYAYYLHHSLSTLFAPVFATVYMCSCFIIKHVFVSNDYLISMHSSVLFFV